MDVQKYLDRIGFQGDIELSLKCLTILQNCHQLAVPFENLDVFTGVKKELVLETLYKKIVDQGRGGWCHELNGLFSWLLKELGFDVRIVSASYYSQLRNEFNAMFDHMALLVNVGGQTYLTDVGFGNISEPFDPIRLTEGHVHQQVGGEYRLDVEDGLWLLRQKRRDVVGHHKLEQNRVVLDTAWDTIIRFDEVERRLEEFQERCDEYQNPATGGLLATLPMVIVKADKGRAVNTLIGARFTTVQFQDNADIRVNKLNLSSESYNAILRETFNIRTSEIDIQKILEDNKKYDE